MGAQSGGKGQRPPDMQAMNMQQGWGGGWQPQQGLSYFTPQSGAMPNPNQPQYGQTPAQGGGYGGGPSMGFGGSWWGPNMPGGPMASWGQAGGNMPPANVRPPTDGINPPPGGNAPPTGMPDFYAGFDPSKSAWGEQGRAAYGENKANEYYKTKLTGNQLFDQFQKINAVNPMAARAFWDQTVGTGGGMNDLQEVTQQRMFGGDVNAYNNWRNQLHHTSMEGKVGHFDLTTGEWKPSQGFNPDYVKEKLGWNVDPNQSKFDLSGLFSGNGPTAPGAGNVAQTPVGGGMIGGNMLGAMGGAQPDYAALARTGGKGAQPPAPGGKGAAPPQRVRDSRWRGLNAGGNPAMRDMAITN